MITLNPILRNSDQAKEAYRGFAMAQMRIMKQWMAFGNLNLHSRTINLDNGTVITLKSCFGKDDVHISIPIVDSSECEIITIENLDCVGVDTEINVLSGHAPYTYEFDQGTISADGVIETINEGWKWGAEDRTELGVVTITDSCPGGAQEIAVDVELCCLEFSDIEGPDLLCVGSIYSVTGGNNLTATFNSGTLEDISEEPVEGEEKVWEWEVLTLDDPCIEDPIITITDVCPTESPNEVIKEFVCCPEMSEISGPTTVEVGAIYSVTGGNNLTATFNSGTLEDISEEPVEGEEKVWEWEVLTLDDPCAEDPLITVTDVCPIGDVNEKEKIVTCDCDPLSITGTDEPIVGSTYTASGGQGDLTFSFPDGTFTRDGNVITITGFDSCVASGADRTSTVSVTDSCTDPQTEEIEVMLPGGEWEFEQITYEASGGHVGDPDDQIVCLETCCGSWEGWAQMNRARYADGTYGVAYFVEGAQMYTDYICDVTQLSRCPAGYDDCSYCGESNEGEAVEACMRGLLGTCNCDVATVLPKDGSTAVQLPYCANTNIVLVARAYYKWVCP